MYACLSSTSSSPSHLSDIKVFCYFKGIVRVIVAARQTLTSGYERPRDEIYACLSPPSSSPSHFSDNKVFCYFKSIVRVIAAARQTLTSGYERPRSLSRW